jgi:predicted TIM-barrel fold metal-dependent hydrolase
LREWLEFVPDKVLFGTDAYDFSAQMNWPEAAWIASHDARNALGIALTGMLDDGEISRARAEEIASLVLRGNAAALYKF